ARQQQQRTAKDLESSQQELEFHVRQADILNERLASQIRDSLDSQAVIATAITEVFQMLRCDRCTFAWLDFERQEWTVVHESRQGYLPAFLRRTSRLPALVRAFERCELLQVDDIASLGNEELRQILEGRRHGAILASRIKTQSGTVGTILCGCTVPRRWTPTDVELLTGVSEQVVIALTQAELYQMAQTNAEEAEAALVALKKTQSQLIRSEKMSSLGQLVAGVAHEINNPVNFIFGNVEYATGYVRDLLELIKGYRAYLSPLPEELKELEEALDCDFVQEDLIKVLRSMRGGAERIREIVKSLRTFSRLDEAERKSADIHSGLDSTLMILGSRLKAKGDRLPIAVTQDYGEIPAIECYPGLLNQVFLNLMGNAIDALESATHDPTWTGETPTLKICTHWLPDTEELEVQIRDNAMGIDAEVQSKLFDPFFTTKPVGKGTGLGLSMSYQIVVETHGGSLECESQPGKGALFTIRLPKEPAPQADSQASPTPDHSQKPIALQ
ncbi:MAG: ATP-binding protein, partial [Cyanobacteria bacterium P01_H01_bin.130]